MGNSTLTYSVLFIVTGGCRGVRGGGRGRPGAFARRRRRCVYYVINPRTMGDLTDDVVFCSLSMFLQAGVLNLSGTSGR
jgi:hypothetical protein